jgi:hypothetical protein
MSREEVCGEEVARLNALREVERELRNAYGDVDDVWPHFAALRAAPSDVEAVVALGRIKAIAAHYRDESKVSLRSSMQAIYETADKAYDPDDLRGYRVCFPARTPRNRATRTGATSIGGATTALPAPSSLGTDSCSPPPLTGCERLSSPSRGQRSVQRAEGRMSSTRWTRAMLPASRAASVTNSPPPTSRRRTGDSAATRRR